VQVILDKLQILNKDDSNPNPVKTYLTDSDKILKKIKCKEFDSNSKNNSLLMLSLFFLVVNQG